jgi:8-oxo-dGTP pyrophosphatase MutT (NUDIX family)
MCFWGVMDGLMQSRPYINPQKYMTSVLMCYTMLMETLAMLTTLRQRLLTLEHAEAQVDTLEGFIPQARNAAVLLPLFEQDGEISLAFIRRATTLRSHSGEIAFPGGSVDATDTSPIMTALREAHEEIGLDPARVDVLGVLPPVFTVVSNFLVTPVVAFLPHGLGEVRIQPSEVQEVLIFSLRALNDPAILHTQRWTRDNRTRLVYFYDYGTYRIWGATGRMLNQFLQTLSQTLSGPST